KDTYEIHIVGRFSKNKFRYTVGKYAMKYVSYDYKKHTRYLEDYHYPREWFENVDKTINSNYKIKTKVLSYDEYFDRFQEYPRLIPIKVYKSYLSEEDAITFDLSVENKHEFVCSEGLLNHNSAQIALGDINDQEYMRAKRWDLGNVPNHRAYSNNSVICNNIEDALANDEFWQGYNGNGEPYGLINLDLSRSCGRLGETEYSDPDVEGYNPSFCVRVTGSCLNG
ncbi:MAG: hypothetical protein ACXACU_19870, partial [Candidatus Hodarchaeales archaeon]